MGCVLEIDWVSNKAHFVQNDRQGNIHLGSVLFEALRNCVILEGEGGGMAFQAMNHGQDARATSGDP